MALKPLDMQVVLSQMDYASRLYLKQYEAANRNQLNYNALYEQKTKDIDQKVSYIKEGLDEKQENYLDPHENQNKNKYTSKNKKRKKISTEEPSKGSIIDVLQ